MTAAQQIDQLIASLTDWRGQALAQVRNIILSANTEITEEWKYMGSPCWYNHGMIAVGNAFKDKIKLVFLYGASLPDPDNIFNAELKGNQRRAVEWHKNDKIEPEPLAALIKAATEFNENKHN